MFDSVIDFLSITLRDGVECSIDDIGSIPEFASLSKLALMGNLEVFFEKHKIQVNPPLDSSEAELQTPRIFSRKRTESEVQRAFVEALKLGECHTVEYKETLSLNCRFIEANPSANKKDAMQVVITHEVMKTIISFLNADGGTLLIGVHDNGEVLGIEREFPYLPNGNSIDRWELYFKDKLNSQIYDYVLLRGYVTYEILSMDDHFVCVVLVQPKHDRLSACCSAVKGQDDCIYVREGNGTRHVKCKDIENLVLHRNKQVKA